MVVAELDVLATWGSKASQASWNGAPLDADASQLGENRVRTACYQGGCLLGISAGGVIQGPGLDANVTDAVLAFEGGQITARATSNDAAWEFTLDALATTPDGARFALGGLFTGAPSSPFGSGLAFPAVGGSVVLSGDTQDGIVDALWLMRHTGASPYPTNDPAADQRAVIGGLALLGDGMTSSGARVAGGARFRDALNLTDDTPTAGDPPYTRMCTIGNDAPGFRWGVFFDFTLSDAPRTEADCRFITTTPPGKGNELKLNQPGIRFETLATSGARQAAGADVVVHAGQYTNNHPDVSLTFADPGGANPHVLPPTGAEFSPFVARSTLATDPPMAVDFADGLALPGALEAAAVHAEGDWLACGTITGEPYGALPSGCGDVPMGQWLVVVGTDHVDRCIPVGVEGRCRAVTATPDGFLLAGVLSSAASVTSTLVVIGSSGEVIVRAARDDVAVDTLGWLDGDILAGGSFTGSLDGKKPLASGGDWDLFLARWLLP